VCNTTSKCATNISLYSLRSKSLLSTVPKISVKKGREYQLLRGHPWLFSGGISQATLKAGTGDIVDLVDINGRFVARGYYNPQCDIAVRVLTLDQSETIDGEFFKRRIGAAFELRQGTLNLKETTTFRLINSEGDFLPGYIVDYFAEHLVVQSHTAGGDKLLEEFIAALKQVITPRSITIRNDAPVRKREGLALAAPEVVHGSLPAELLVSESSFKYKVDILEGQKTGFFTDQRDKRIALAKYARSLTPEAKAANLFCYSGAFSVVMAAANPGLAIVNVDESQQALELARTNIELNNLPVDRQSFTKIDAFKWLESTIQANDRYDLLILDPPSFAKTRKEKESALKGYHRLNQLGLQCVEQGGFLVTCSCTGTISMEEFLEVIHDSAARHRRSIQILERFQNGLDHPVSIAAPETSYLKVLICRVF
jgi:23S rRNA (cytosine1962-C5)-methyltransferase